MSGGQRHRDINTGPDAREDEGPPGRSRAGTVYIVLFNGTVRPAPPDSQPVNTAARPAVHLPRLQPEGLIRGIISDVHPGSRQTHVIRCFLRDSFYWLLGSRKSQFISVLCT